MKVFAAPAGYEAPDFSEYFVDGHYDRDKAEQVDAAYIEKLRGWLKAKGFTGKLSGKVVSFHVYDGFARYLVAQGNGKTFLIHINLGDGYGIPAAHARGLRVKDIAEMVKRSEVVL